MANFRVHCDSMKKLCVHECEFLWITNLQYFSTFLSLTVINRLFVSLVPSRLPMLSICLAHCVLPLVADSFSSPRGLRRISETNQPVGWQAWITPFRICIRSAMRCYNNTLIKYHPDRGWVALNKYWCPHQPVKPSIHDL
jgi:hypothetical protein